MADLTIKKYTFVYTLYYKSCYFTSSYCLIQPTYHSLHKKKIREMIKITFSVRNSISPNIKCLKSLYHLRYKTTNSGSVTKDIQKIGSYFKQFFLQHLLNLSAEFRIRHAFQVKNMVVFIYCPFLCMLVFAFVVIQCFCFSFFFLI